MFMRSMKNDPNIKLSQEDFKKPDIDFTIELDCSKYKQPTNNATSGGVIDPFQR
ncbi:MAG: hypothetical protein ACI9UJ_002580 [bacterium]